MKTLVVLFAALASSSSYALDYSPVIVKSAETGALCPDAAPGESCRVTWDEAIQFCKSRGAKLPTARVYADWLKHVGVRTIERSEVDANVVPAGFYLVDCVNADGSRDGFYMNHSGYRRPNDGGVNYLLWTASSPPSHPEYAHVYYNEWGGGGGHPADHLKSKRNSFQCVSGGN